MTTTDTLAGLLRAICENPKDDTLRLVYADALEEDGQAERAEFIRNQIELPTHPVCEHERHMGIAPSQCRRCRLRGRIAYAMEHDIAREEWACPPEWFTCTSPAPLDWQGEERYSGWVHIARGFVSEIRCRCSDWLAHGPAIVAVQPVERVVITDKEPDHEEDNLWRWYGNHDAIGYLHHAVYCS